MAQILPQLQGPQDLKRLSLKELEQLAQEIRQELCRLLAVRTAHFASNLGVVELCLALHRVFDFSQDRLIWDTGHQIYPHKLITGRYRQFPTIRKKGGLMGYPNPQESPYDLFMTGHAGCSVATMLGIRVGDELQGQSHRHAVAVIGDGALPSGIVFEALNNAGGMKRPLLVILNDNEMSICPRVGGLAQYLDRLRMHRFYRNLKREVVRFLKSVPVVGDPAERFLWQLKEAVKAGFHGGMLFEELGFDYVGPVDGHNLSELIRYLEMVKRVPRPILLHVLTKKGYGFPPAEQDPVTFHTPSPFRHEGGQVIPLRPKGSQPTYTSVAAETIYRQMECDPRVTVITAAMCQGNKLERVRDDFPDRFFDTGICESFAVAFAAGKAKVGMRPIVDIYSTFLQRAFDQIFQEVALQDLPVVFMMDRAGLTGPDGPTHHGVFDLGYMRLFPNMIVAVPGDAEDLRRMVPWALSQPHPVAIRYPKAPAVSVPRQVAPVELGRWEVVRDGPDGTILCCGTLLHECLEAAQVLAQEDQLELTVVNARFVKPLDRELLEAALVDSPFVLTVEEAALHCGFGSAVLEAAADAGLPTEHVHRLGIPDRFIEHGERHELLADLDLDCAGVVRTCRRLAGMTPPCSQHRSTQRRRVS